eukprot:11189829-Lingulodinium_polyedra.AAC.1
MDHTEPTTTCQYVARCLLASPPYGRSNPTRPVLIAPKQHAAGGGEGPGRALLLPGSRASRWQG